MLKANNRTGYFGVNFAKPGRLKPYKAYVWRDGKRVHLGYFATAEEAALCVARSRGCGVAGSAAAKRVSSASLMSEEEGAANVPATADLQGQAQRTGAGDTVDLTTPQDALPGESTTKLISSTTDRISSLISSPTHTKPDGAPYSQPHRSPGQV